jgi:hypothetical protein
LRSEAPFQLRLANRTPTRASFRIVNRPPTEMPRTIALFDMDIPIWLRPMMETEPNGLTGLSVAQLVRGWLLLHTVFELIYNRDTRRGIAEHATRKPFDHYLCRPPISVAALNPARRKTAPPRPRMIFFRPPRRSPTLRRCAYRTTLGPAIAYDHQAARSPAPRRTGTPAATPLSAIERGVLGGVALAAARRSPVNYLTYSICVKLT